MKTNTFSLIFVFLLTGFALLQPAHAVVPPPDGGYPGGNTAEGQAALLALSSGQFNTGVGFFSLLNNTTGSLNTALGAATLASNTTADQNTATGAGALLSNTTGEFNTANGALALLSNTTGIQNVAVGTNALNANTDASFNTAIGSNALAINSVGQQNTAVGAFSLPTNTSGQDNVAVGLGALHDNTTGSNNIAVGLSAGFNQTTGSNNIYIGGGPNGVAGESNACYIASIFGQTSADGVTVLINSDHKLGTLTSSKRFKKDIKPMDSASKELFALKPVSFRYNQDIDAAGRTQYGLVAEDVEKVNPDLVVRDKEGKAYSVRYEQVNAMLLNEFLNEHRTVAEHGATIARLEKQIEALTEGLQKVSTQLALSKTAPQTVSNNQ
ncbi:MAG TPA: tail fiber domain-containing protein [Candidatus Udaeobacter sp.]|nr:tail fiber domain-containing protein [Candidatus Udaeobacter sp.]